MPDETNPTGANTAAVERELYAPNDSHNRDNHCGRLEIIKLIMEGAAIVTGVGILCAQLYYNHLSVQALETANESLNVSKKALDEQKDNAQKQLRAYIGIDATITKEETVNGVDSALSLVMKNGGLTPARNITVEAAWFKTQMPPPGQKLELGKDFKYPILPDNHQNRMPILPVGKLQLAPGQDSVLRIGTRSPVGEYPIENTAYNFAFATFVYGDITYTDIYNVSYCRNFCYILLDTTGKGATHASITEFHNDEFVIP